MTRLSLVDKPETGAGSKSGSGAAYDIIIVGSGWSGGACYARLKKILPPHCKVLIIERGDFFHPTQADLTIPYQPGERVLRKVYPVRRGQGRNGLLANSVGGASHFTQVCVRESKAFLEKTLAGKIPNLDALYEEYVQFQAQLSTTDPCDSHLDRAMVRAFKAEGLKQGKDGEFEHPNENYFGILRRYYAGGIKKTIMELVPNRSYGSDVMANTEALRICYDQDRNPSHILVRHDPDRKLSKQMKPVKQFSRVKLAPGGIVISAGNALLTPKLLLASKIRSEYGNDHIGENFRERPGLTLVLFGLDQTQLYRTCSSTFTLKTVSVEVIKNPNSRALLMAYSFGEASWFTKLCIDFLVKLGLGKVLDHMMTKTISTCVLQLNGVESAGSIFLPKPSAPTETVTATNNLSDPRDLENFLADLPRVERIYKRVISELTWFERVVNYLIIFFRYRDLFSKNPEKVANYIKRRNHSLCHFSGTCSLGTALNDDFSVKGVNRTYVADMSAFPVMHEANPSLLSLLLGHHVASVVAKVVRSVERPSSEKKVARKAA